MVIMLTACTVLSAPFPRMAFGGKLSQAGAAVQKGSGGSSSNRDRRSRGGHRDNDGDYGFFNLLFDLLDPLFCSVLGDGPSSSTSYSFESVQGVNYEYGPEYFEEVDQRIQTPCAFAAYPYENSIEGLHINPWDENVEPRGLSKRVLVEYGSNFDDIQYLSTSLVIETPSRLVFDASWRTYWEDLGTMGTDDLSIAELNAGLRLAQGRHGSVRFMLGVPFVEYNGRIDGGLGATLAGEFFPVRPLVVAFDTNLAKAGGATLFHARSTVGVLLRQGEVFTGIDHLRLGDSDLTTMVFGLRLWW